LLLLLRVLLPFSVLLLPFLCVSVVKKGFAVAVVLAVAPLSSLLFPLSPW
jgi:hypothetical protein